MYELTFEELLTLIKIALAMKQNSTDEDTYIANEEGFNLFCDVILDILSRHNKQSKEKTK